MTDITEFDNEVKVEYGEVSLPIVAPDDVKLDKIPVITDLFTPQELRADALHGGDYMDTPIYVHDFEIVKTEKKGTIIVASVIIPEANEYGTMHLSAWRVRKIFEGIHASGKFEPFIMELYEIPTSLGNPTYGIKT